MVLGAVIGLTMTGGAWAAEQGELGETSTGKTEITFEVGTENGGGGSILIDKLDNIPLGKFEAGTPQDLVGFSNFCVYRTGKPNGFTFDLTATSDRGGAAFELHKTELPEGSAPGANQKITYEVSFSSDDNNGVGGVDLTHGEAKGVNAGSSVGLEDNGSGYECTGENVSILVSAILADASTAETGTYTDTLSLLVAPN